MLDDLLNYGLAIRLDCILEFLHALACLCADWEELNRINSHEFGDEFLAICEILLAVVCIYGIHLVNRKVELGCVFLCVFEKVNLDLVNRAVHGKHEYNRVTFLDIGISCV